MEVLFWPLVLGAVQGITEFFPISSSAHLSLFPFIFNFTDPGLTFDIALHAGTFFAILLALKDDWFAMVKSIFKNDTFYRKLILLLVVTTIPGAIFGYYLEDAAATVFRNPMITVFTLVAFGFILYFVDAKVKSSDQLEKLTLGKALLVGLSQALALVPGVSRSGATITAGRALGLSREASVRYSFLAALPIILGASIFGLRDASLTELTSAPWILGFAASFAASFWAIKFLLNYVKKHDFKIFLYYRIGLAALVIVLILMRG